MSKDKAYYCAIENLAWEIDRLSKESQAEFVDANSHLTPTELMDLAANKDLYSEDHNRQWTLLDDITFKISEIYHVPVHEVQKDTWAILIENMLKE